MYLNNGKGSFYIAHYPVRCSGGSRNVRKGGAGPGVTQPSPAGGLGGAL